MWGIGLGCPELQVHVAAGAPGWCRYRGRAAPWAAARPLAVRAASFARRVGSLPGQALPPPTGTAAWPSGSLRTGAGGVFLHEAFWWRVADVSDPRVAKFFSFGGGEVVVSGSAVPKVQTTSVKNVENGVLWVRWSAFWAQRCLA